MLVPVVTERRERNAQRAENLRGVHAQKKRRAAILFLGCHVPSPLFGDRYLVPSYPFFSAALRAAALRLLRLGPLPHFPPTRRIYSRRAARGGLYKKIE